MVVLKSVEENLEQLPSIAAIHQTRGINDTAVLQKDRARHGKIASRLKGTRKLVDHVASENLMNCLKNKREAERKYKESEEKDGVYNMTCDKVDAKVRVKEDGSWEILEILGRHEQAYERKKVYE